MKYKCFRWHDSFIDISKWLIWKSLRYSIYVIRRNIDIECNHYIFNWLLKIIYPHERNHGCGHKNFQSIFFFAIKYYLPKHLNFIPNLCLDLDVNTFPQDNSSKKVDKKVFLVGLNKNPFGWLCIRNIKQAAVKGKYITM